MIVGYERVSPSNQSISTQVNLLKKNHCENVYTDIASGMRDGMTGLNNMLSSLKKGDLVIVHKTDRIFRSRKHMVNLIETFKEKGVLLKSLNEPEFDITTALEDAFKRKKSINRSYGAKKESLEKYHYTKQWYDRKNIALYQDSKETSKGNQPSFGYTMPTFYEFGFQSRKCSLKG